MAARLISLASALLCAACAARGHGRPSAAAEDGYTLTVTSAPAAHVGEPVISTLRLEPREPFMVTRDYPHVLTISGPSVCAPQALRVESGDLDVVTRDELVESLLLRCTAPGSHQLSAVLEFGLCTAERCEELTARRTWTVEVR